MTLVFPTDFFSAIAPRRVLPQRARVLGSAWNILQGSQPVTTPPTVSHIQIVDSSEAVEAAPSIESSATDAPTILVVDDETVVRDVAVKMLQRNGYRALEAADGAEALRVFEDKHSEISAVLMDLVMPVMSGEEAFRAIREIDAKVPVIFSSGYSAKVVRARCGLMRPDGILQKPYHDSQLIEVLRQAF